MGNTEKVAEQRIQGEESSTVENNGKTVRAQESGRVASNSLVVENNSIRSSNDNVNTRAGEQDQPADPTRAPVNNSSDSAENGKESAAASSSVTHYTSSNGLATKEQSRATETPPIENKWSTDSSCSVVEDGTSTSQVAVQQYIRTLSTALSDPREHCVDRQLLQSVLSQAGEFSYGIAAIEVYSFQDPRLVPVDCWFQDGNNVSVADETERDLVLNPEICVPGVDLVGALWQHSTNGDAGMRQVPSLSSLKNPRSWSVSFRQRINNDSPRSSLPQPPPTFRGLYWRELKSQIEDPDAIHGPRLEAMYSAGFERATGVGFDIQGTRGMVVYYAKQGADVDLLSAVANETYLRRTALLVGSALTMAESRRASVAFQRQSTSSPTRETDVETAHVQQAANITTRPSKYYYCNKVRGRAVAWYRKLWGGGSQVPPGMPFVETLWTILGVFVGLLTISSVNELFESKSEYYVLLPPFGALMTLQYGLTAAPASSPRSIVLGHAVALAIALAFTYIPEMILPVWIRLMVAPAFAIGAMVKLGVTHPPAGAFSILFASGNYSWGFYGVAVLCSIISIIPATIVNNMSQKRQYPTHWGVPRCVRRAFGNDKKKRERNGMAS